MIVYRIVKKRQMHVFFSKMANKYGSYYEFHYILAHGLYYNDKISILLIFNISTSVYQRIAKRRFFFIFLNLFPSTVW